MSTMKRTRFLPILLVLTLTLSGCAVWSAYQGHGPIQSKIDPLVTRADIERELGQPAATTPLPGGITIATYEYQAAEPSEEIAENILGIDFMTLGLAEIGWTIMSWRGEIPPKETFRRTVTYGPGGEVLANSIYGRMVYAEEAAKQEKAGDAQGAALLRDAAIRFYPAR